MQKISLVFSLWLEKKKIKVYFIIFAYTFEISEWESTKKYTRSTIVVEENEYRIIRNIK